MNPRSLKYAVALASVLTLSTGVALAQATTTTATPQPAADTAEETITLTPFEVTSDKDVGYSASTTLAGNRLNTELRDVGSAVSVVTEQFMKDIGATDNKTLLQYTVSTEVGSSYGNFTGGSISSKADESGTFTNPNSNTRVRGLMSADNTRDFFMSNIPWDGYNIERVDLQRGPNSILFGQGSPAGIINNSTKTAKFKNSGETSLRIDDNGSVRASLDLNRVLLKGQLAARVMAVENNEKYKQKPAFEKSDRLFGTLRYEPSFLNRNGVSTIVLINAERGEINANHPRSITPMDFVTPWFKTGTTNVDAAGNIVSGTGAGITSYANLNKQYFDPFLVQDKDSGYVGGRGQYQPRVTNSAGATVTNPSYNTWLGQFAQNFGGPLAIYDGNSSAVQKVWVPVVNSTQGISSTGSIDRGIGGFAYGAQVGIDPWSKVAQRMGVANPYAVKDVYLSDASIFDFYNNLLDGPNKKEWNNFNTSNLNLAQTYFNNRLGWQFAYDAQHYSQGQVSLLTDFRQAIYIDMMGTLIDGSINPNRGRPFISDGPEYGNNSYSSDRESKRATGFYVLDFTNGKKNILNKALGKHTFTAMFANDSVKDDSRSFMRYRVNSDYTGYTSFASYRDLANQINPIVYLGGSLADRSSASGAYIPRPTEEVSLDGITSTYGFNSKWKATSVDPAATWTNPWYNPAFASSTSTQSENPANYVGWSQIPMTFLQAEDGHADEMTYSATLKKNEVTSRALVWQGQLWNKLLIGNFGIRNDISRSWVTAANPDANSKLVSVAPSSYKLNEASDTRVQETSQSWSIVAHVSELLPSNFPFRISFMYNKSENFSPAAARWDIYGNQLGTPHGKTWDKSFVISTKDEKYSFKVTKFETRAVNISSTGAISSNSWFLSGMENWGANHADKYQYNLYDLTKPTEIAVVGKEWAYNYYGDVDTATSTSFEAADVAAWRAHQKNVPQAFYDAFQIRQNTIENHAGNFKYGNPSFTEDLVSKGMEFEVNANPTSQWRVSLNAAKVEAARSNSGGAAFLDFVSIVEKDFAVPAGGGRSAGDLRIWGGSPGHPTIRSQWDSTIGATVALQKQQNGLSNPEVRKWRVNLVSNYTFKGGLLKGFGVGGGYRWQDKIVIGYPVLPAVNGQKKFDIENPYYGPSESSVDAWVSYGHKVTKSINWQVQLNIRNLTADNSLIPLTAQQDGSYAAFRIAPPRVISLTNSFQF